MFVARLRNLPFSVFTICLLYFLANCLGLTPKNLARYRSMKLSPVAISSNPREHNSPKPRITNHRPAKAVDESIVGFHFR